MPSDAQQHVVSPEALARQHESRNPPVGWIFLGAALVVLLTLSCLVVVQFLISSLAAKHLPDPATGARGTITAPDLRLLERFPSPHLQVRPHDDLMSLRTREDAALSSYGWVDRSNGIVRIPIQRAMDLMAQRGGPTRASNRLPSAGKSSLELIEERSQKR